MYTDSTLVKYLGSGSEKRFVRTKPISRITVHQTAGVVSLDGLNAIINDARRDVSWHYGIDVNGTIGKFMSEQYATYSSNNTENDNVAINIIVSNSDDSKQYPVSDKTYQALIKLCVDICQRNEIQLKYTGRPEDSTLTMHRWYHRTICPGPYLASRFNDIAIQVAAEMAKTQLTKYGIKLPSASAIRTGSAYTPSDFIDYTALNPYVVTVEPRRSKPIKWTTLRDHGVAGALLYAGELYDDIHLKRSVYQFPNLDTQIKECRSAEMPYGLIAKVKARSVDEAQAELSELRLVARRYVPTLGMWLELNLSKSNAVNDLILERYLTELRRWGFNNQIGVYATPAQLSKISWKAKFSELALCINEHVKRVDTIQSLMTQSFFAVE